MSYYPEHGKLFVKEIHDKIESTDVSSGDEQLLKILNDKKKTLIGIDAPLTLPKCLSHKCPGIKKCKLPTTRWHWAEYKKHKKKKKNLKLFTSYTERCVERHINYNLEEFFEIPEALGANKAPLTVRSVYLKNGIKSPVVEVFPRLSMHRIGLNLKISKSDLKDYRHSANGMECRILIIEALISSGILFIYEQDAQKFVDSPYAFDSLITALTAYLKFKNQCEVPPKGFPKEEGWISFPNKDFNF